MTYEFHWKSDSYSTDQETAWVLWNLNINYCGHKTPSLQLIPRSLYTFNTSKILSLRSTLTLISHPQQGLDSCGFPTKILCAHYHKTSWILEQFATVEMRMHYLTNNGLLTHTSTFKLCYFYTIWFLLASVHILYWKHYLQGNVVILFRDFSL